MTTAPTTLLLLRHGDRYDFANKQVWRRSCQRLGHEARDPPLSALGAEQARQTAAFLSQSGSVDAILVSPYLRTIQTAQPIAHAASLPLNVEVGLAEWSHGEGVVPTAAERKRIFPEIDDEYVPILERAVVTGSGANETGVDYLRRMMLMARELPRRFPGQRVVCVSHAASVAIVAALTGQTSLVETGTFAPCGIWELESTDGGESWAIIKRGDDNSGHVSSSAPTTYAWGFEHSRDPAAHERHWLEAIRLGPTVAVVEKETAATLPAARTSASGGLVAQEIAVLCACYGAMVVSQAYGGAIIEAFHGHAARAALEDELSPPGSSSVAPDSPLEALCAGYAYEKLHWHSLANVLHVSGKLLTFLLLLGVGLGHFARRSLAWAPPLWYLYGWAGHFLLQKDIPPAVFTYAQTPSGWLKGEWCSIRGVVGAISTPVELLLTLTLVLWHLLVLPPWSFKSERLRIANPRRSKSKLE